MRVVCSEKKNVKVRLWFGMSGVEENRFSCFQI